MPRRTVAVLLVVMGALAVGLGTAGAEPGFISDTDDIVGAGSVLTEDVIDDLAAAYPASGMRRLASFDGRATGRSTTVMYRDPDRVPGSSDDFGWDGVLCQAMEQGAWPFLQPISWNQCGVPVP